jgi:hypothetical protein
VLDRRLQGDDVTLGRRLVVVVLLPQPMQRQLHRQRFTAHGRNALIRAGTASIRYGYFVVGWRAEKPENASIHASLGVIWGIPD